MEAYGNNSDGAVWIHTLCNSNFLARHIDRAC
jgi:hypothetical protein